MRLSKIFYVAVSLFVGTVSAVAQTFETKETDIAQKIQRYVNTNRPDSLFQLLSQNTQRILTQDRTRAVVFQITNQFGTLDSLRLASTQDSISRYKAIFAKGPLLLTFSLDKNQKIGTLTFTPYVEKATSVSTSTFIEKAYEVKSSGSHISGTLTLPKSITKPPVVIIISGSGPTDRDGNQPGMQNNSLRMLAHGLADSGIASIRYDKRGVGQSKGSIIAERDVTFDVYCKDATTLVDSIIRSKHYEKTYILGHSEGGLVGIMVSQQAAVSGLLLVNSQAERASDLLRRQFRQTLPDSTRESADKAISQLESGKPISVPLATGLNLFFRPSVQPYLISWVKLDPIKEIKKVNMPVLLVQGEEDIQTGPDQAKVLASANNKIKYVVLSRMNHIFKNSSSDRSDNIATYNDPKASINPELIPTIISFIKKE